MTIVAMTGASGTMGKEAVASLMRAPDVKLRVLLRTTARGRTCATRLQKSYGARVEILFGDIRSYADCLRLIQNAQYLIHLAAVIPPRADHEPEGTMTTNRNGTCHLVDAVLESGNHTKFIHISTVAIYGHRTEAHPWGRVGDPLVTSAFDVYGLSKTMAERYVLDSDLAHWVVLRQTGVLYDNILMNNISDGLIFHTPWNVPIEWVTARDSGVLLANLIQRDLQQSIDGFWQKVYNIGGGADARQTGYETFEAGFQLIGGSAKRFFAPNWNLPRNFHCFWFSDSDILEELFHFRSQSCADFWRWYQMRHRLYAAGRLMPAALLRKLVIEPLLKNRNAPVYWLKQGDQPRIQAFFGGQQAFEQIPAHWEEVALLCERADYAQLKQYDQRYALNHGYDENKPDAQLGIEDMRQAAAFRGGRCLSPKMTSGNLYTKLLWQCHEGHTFEASPYTVLKAGHWCSDCCTPEYQWRMDVVAKHSLFHAQIWNDSHSPDENYIYSLQNGTTAMEAVK